MAYETIIYETDGPLARITLNRPERLNAISLRMPDELEAAVGEANANPQVRVIVLRGAGRAFCAGFALEPGYAPARVWGSPLTAMWVYRLSAEWAKRLLLTGDPVDGRTAERIGLINKAVPAGDLEGEVEALARRIAQIPASQLVSMKLLVNQAYENMGLRTTQLLGSLLDGLMRHTPEGLAWRRLIDEKGIREALRRRDVPFGDYSAGRKP